MLVATNHLDWDQLKGGDFGLIPQRGAANGSSFEALLKSNQPALINISLWK